MSTATQLITEQCFPTQPLRPADLAGSAQPELCWLWRGYLAAHKTTALISPPKSGKTTLLSILLARFAQGGQLAGLPVAPARIFVVSEESPADWDARCRRLGIGEHVQFLCRPFQGARPTDKQWLDLIAGLAAEHRRAGLDLVVFDALATLLPGYAETCAPKLLDCLLPVQALADLGPAVWLLHHPAKAQRADGQNSRGTIALPGFADIVMEMHGCRRARSRDRRRRICGYSRYAETPRQRIVELNEAGDDYLLASDAAGTPLVKKWPEMLEGLANAWKKFTQQEIQLFWASAEDDDKPDRTTLLRWLTRATQQGLICRSGSGRSNDAFVYWLPGREPLLWPGDHASEADQEAWRQRRREEEQRRKGEQAAARGAAVRSGAAFAGGGGQSGDGSPL